jgi:hypothetical protein
MHWGPFVVVRHDPMTPRFRTAADLDNGEREFLEAELTKMPAAPRPMWRVGGDGFASLIHGWWEDNSTHGQAPQTCLSPTILAKEVAGCVLFARAFANSFEAATAATFRCEWTGLKGRRPYDTWNPWAHLLSSGHISEDDRRVSNRTFPLSELNVDWLTPTAVLAGAAFRAVGFGDVTADRLEAMVRGSS